MRGILFILTFFFVFPVAGQVITSPDGNTKAEFYQQDTHSGKQLFYKIFYKEKPVILESALGISLWTDNKPFSVTEIKEENRTGNDTVWVPLYGERNKIRDCYNAIELSLSDSSQVKRSVHIQVRAYNQGIAFRYFLPEHPEGGEYLHITSEQTKFSMPEGTRAWYTPVAQAPYELLTLSGWPGECERPLTLELSNGLYACLAEAQVVNYCRTKFVLSRERKNTICCSTYGAVDEITPFYSPWRVIMVAEKPGNLLENNDIILNLNPPSELENTWWIKPGKIMREMTLSTAGALKLVDFAVQRNLQYIHFDAGWYGYEYTSIARADSVGPELKYRPRGGLDLPKVIDYARRNNIGVFLYVNQRELARHLDELLPIYREWGISGIKFGFVQVGSHRWTTWMHEAVKKCADYKLMVDIHDEYRPTGFSRTFPNLLTQEGIHGNEGMPDATHNATLPFTRFIAGAADYTICYQHKRLKTTNAHQLALSVICYSPLQFLYWYAKPTSYNDEPDLEFFDKVPTIWDDTKVLQGEIGKYAAIARRSGDNWFLGVITGNEGREMKTELDFLESDKTYVANIFYDGGDEIKTKTKVGIARYLVDRSTVLKMQLKDSGGEAVYFLPATKTDIKNLKKYK